MKQEVKILQKWLHKNKASYMAWRLGYDHSTAITNWIHNDSIPGYQLDRVMEIINEVSDDDSNGKAKKATFGAGLRA